MVEVTVPRGRTGDRCLPHLIDGVETPGLAGRTFTTVDPATSAELVTLAFGESEDVDRGVAAAAAAAHRDRRWSGLAPQERAESLRAVGRCIRQRAEEIAKVESADTGKPLAHARAEIEGAAHGFSHYADLVRQPTGMVYPADADRFLYSRRIPYGVVAAISPWNYPWLRSPATWGRGRLGTRAPVWGGQGRACLDRACIRPDPPRTGLGTYVLDRRVR